MCLDLTGPGKAQTWIQREISSSSTLCEENDQTLIKVDPALLRERGLSVLCVGWDSSAVFTVECLIAQTRS